MATTLLLGVAVILHFVGLRATLAFFIVMLSVTLVSTYWAYLEYKIMKQNVSD
ncbi:hypothetical protein H0266_14730 [Halobacillus locisalis]|uniref:Uncharacterized protein n=1 Tax=Halobacillus locisalis TaxID=220753 RepID=A0A838CWD5_9BACI|nr:hypothetical protein [Halobacillus locisalis]MBA2176149.1 hypothetical protein [Halobacillus locisalis]